MIEFERSQQGQHQTYDILMFILIVSKGSQKFIKV